ncbi:GlsB/YeaQ/YmgE family stress response membrane protein [Falsiroseomonas oryziterrae]|uniref:GlsB/YeaQ/YmgE family stress response membrane protein n=1 Tax=Falsiroseomonas oryziterrae TaxID=2911368 RepID=UPI0027E19549|nr:GlsB/YeaQ/YmgE family stress response membrane protein [Roseomonas sp. NPKOSM-4]
MMGILGTIIIGFLAGAIAKWVTPGRGPGGFFVTVCLGILGAFVGTFLGQGLGWYGPGQTAGLFGAIVGAVLVLVVFRAVAKKA